MDRLVYLLLILIFVSCDNLKQTKKEKITFYFTDNISADRHVAIADYVTAEIKQLKLEDLGLETIKVDSVPFSIVLYIPYSNEDSREADFKHLSNLLSRFDFEQTPVHVVLTDEKFNPTKSVPYDKDAVTYDGETMTRGRAKVKQTDSARKFSADILEQVLRNRMPELYKGGDSVRILVDMVNDTVKIDFNIDRQVSNLDTLKKQFLSTDRLFFDLLFERRTILFHVRDKTTEDLITVLGLKGE